MGENYPVVITVATYRRPELLQALLHSLEKQTMVEPGSFHAVVVDNDPERSAASVVGQYSAIATYVSEPSPGIAAARNAAVEAAYSFSPSALVFIDDDEVAPNTWLAELLKVWRATGADVVTGPVRYILPPGAKYLQEAVNYFQTVQRDNQSSVQDVATNNTLVSSKWFYNHPNLRFNESYSLTGGSDLELFYRLQDSGGTCVWAAQAMVEETVPAGRATQKWVRQRDLRNGQLQARLRMERQNESRHRIAMLGVMRILKGAGLLVASRAASPRRIHAWHVFEKGRGYIKASNGNFFKEYALARKTEG